jgi:hypothetical protein
VRKNVSIAGLLLAWLCANGALLDLVQVFAWGRMFAGYTETMNVAAALRATFDPQKPCDLCLHVADAKGVARQQSAPAPSERTAPKLDLVCDEAAPIVFATFSDDWPAAQASIAPGRVEAVDVPPPRV